MNESSKQKDVEDSMLEDSGFHFYDSDQKWRNAEEYR